MSTLIPHRLQEALHLALAATSDGTAHSSFPPSPLLHLRDREHRWSRGELLRKALEVATRGGYPKTDGRYSGHRLEERASMFARQLYRWATARHVDILNGLWEGGFATWEERQATLSQREENTLPFKLKRYKVFVVTLPELGGHGEDARLRSEEIQALIGRIHWLSRDQGSARWPDAPTSWAQLGSQPFQWGVTYEDGPRMTSVARIRTWFEAALDHVVARREQVHPDNEAREARMQDDLVDILGRLGRLERGENPLT